MPLSLGAAALIARMSPAPNPSRAMLIASTYDRMAARSYWTKLDCLYLLAAHNSQASRLNWKANEFNIAVSGSPTFATDRGWVGALSSYLDTGFAPSTAGRNYALNSATLMGWSITAGAVGIDANLLSVGLFSHLGGSATGYLCPRRTTDQINARINDPAGITASNTATHGMFTARRDGAANRDLGYDDVFVAGGGQVSSSITAGNLILHPGEDIVSNLTMGAAAAGSAVNDTEFAQLYNDLLPYLRSVEAVPDTIMAGAAQWLSERTFEISSLDSGPVSFVEPWGGSEFGHSYTFAISDAPSGVTIDSDAGLLSAASPLSPGSYTFPVVVTNLKDISKVSTFWITIAVREGVATNRTGYQVLHKDYVVDSGTYGSPSGSDYTNVLLAIRTAIVADQATAGDNNLCATIVFTAGTRYDYLDNRWTFGIQRLKVRTTVAGARAQLRCIFNDVYAIAVCGLQIGRGWMDNSLPYPNPNHGDNSSRTDAYFINTVTAGSTSITLKTAGDASNFTVGRWATIASYDQQTDGWPANCRYVDYVKITNISGAVITFDRKMRWTHRDTYWEGTSPNSVGKARIFPIDRSDCRATLRVHMQDIEFLLNPNVTTDSRRFVYCNAIEQYYTNVVSFNLCTSQSRHSLYLNCDQGGSELDKLTTRLVMIGGDTTKEGSAGVNGGTGMELILQKNVTAVSGAGPMPMQWRIIGGTQNGITYNPVQIAGFAVRQIWAKGVSFTGKSPVLAAWLPVPVTIGSGGVTYSGGVLTVPIGATNFDIFCRVAWEGAIIMAGDWDPARSGYITQIARNSDDTAILYSITWLTGTPPASNSAMYICRAHEVIIDDSCTATPVTSFAPFYETIKQITPSVTPRGFPVGYPASTYGF